MNLWSQPMIISHPLQEQSFSFREALFQSFLDFLQTSPQVGSLFLQTGLLTKAPTLPLPCFPSSAWISTSPLFKCWLTPKLVDRSFAVSSSGREECDYQLALAFVRDSFRYVYMEVMFQVQSKPKFQDVSFGNCSLEMDTPPEEWSLSEIDARDHW